MQPNKSRSYLEQHNVDFTYSFAIHILKNSKPYSLIIFKNKNYDL